MILSALGASVACLLAPPLVANASSNAPTCSAHAQLGTGSVSVTFSCSAAIRRLQLVVPAATRSSTRPKLQLGSRAWPCAVAGRMVACTHAVPARRAGAVVLAWRPDPVVGDPILFTATAPTAKIDLHLTVSTPDDGD